MRQLVNRQTGQAQDPKQRVLLVELVAEEHRGELVVEVLEVFLDLAAQGEVRPEVRLGHLLATHSHRCVLDLLIEAYYLGLLRLRALEADAEAQRSLRVMISTVFTAIVVHFIDGLISDVLQWDPKLHLDLKQEFVQVRLRRVRLLGEFKRAWQTRHLIELLGLIGLERVKLQLDEDELVQAHRDPHLIRLDHFEKVLELAWVTSNRAERRTFPGHCRQCSHVSQREGIARMHVAVEKVGEGQGDLAVLPDRSVLRVGVLDAQEEFEVAQDAQLGLKDELDLVVALWLALLLHLR